MTLTWTYTASYYSEQVLYLATSIIKSIDRSTLFDQQYITWSIPRMVSV